MFPRGDDTLPVDPYAAGVADDLAGHVLGGVPGASGSRGPVQH